MYSKLCLHTIIVGLVYRETFLGVFVRRLANRVQALEKFYLWQSKALQKYSKAKADLCIYNIKYNEICTIIKSCTYV